MWFTFLIICSVYGLSEQTCPDKSEEPLILTPYISSGKLEEAQKLSRVHGLPKQLVAFSGFLTVNKTYDSNLFFVYFPVTKGVPGQTPTLLWLQGGPGATSLFGLFEENGPLKVNSNGNLTTRKYHWASFHNVIYIDNPAGTGFSYTCKEEGYAKNQEDVARDLYEALRQIFQLFPDLQNSSFYVTGESYAGKYVPAITRKIHLSNPGDSVNINLKGMAIGNGLTDPETMVDQSDFLHEIGLFDVQARDKYRSVMNQVVDLVKQEKWLDAFNAWDPMLNGDKFPYKTFFTNVTGYTNYFNYLHPKPYIVERYPKYLQSELGRSQFHVGKLNMSDGGTVEGYLLEDMPKSVKPWVQEILNAGYEVLYYSGSLDIIVATTTTERFLRSLQWKYAEEFNNATRKIYYVNQNVIGHWKKVGNLAFVIIRNAGHMVPRDQPLVASDLITRFTRNKSY